MKENSKKFDEASKSWDSNQRRQKLAEGVFSSIKKNVNLNKEMRALDFGCGTGLVSLRLQPFVKEIVGADSSRGMLEVFEEKIASANLNNAKTLYLEDGNLSALSGSYDLIVSSMTLHHIKDLEGLFLKFADLLKDGGFLCLADLDSDDGLFHEDNAGVYHYGFDRRDLISLLERSGFTYFKDLTAAEVEKEIPSGQRRIFSIFLIICRK